jgi:hypothetical protein
VVMVAAGVGTVRHNGGGDGGWEVEEGGWTMRVGKQ